MKLGYVFSNWKGSTPSSADDVPRICADRTCQAG